MLDKLVDHYAVAEALAEPDNWRGSLDGRPTLLEKDLFIQDGYKVTLHKMIAPDDACCFHSHPAVAFRMVLSGGYEEEFLSGKVAIREAGYIGIVEPDTTHRISKLLNGKESISLWVRMPKTNETKLVGDGWKTQSQ